MGKMSLQLRRISGLEQVQSSGTTGRRSRWKCYRLPGNRLKTGKRVESKTGPGFGGTNRPRGHGCWPPAPSPVFCTPSAVTPFLVPHPGACGCVSAAAPLGRRCAHRSSHGEPLSLELPHRKSASWEALFFSCFFQKHFSDTHGCHKKALFLPPPPCPSSAVTTGLLHGPSALFSHPQIISKQEPKNK